MAKAQITGIGVNVEITLVINEAEARALDGMFSYGAEAFLKGFYKCLGKAYVQPFEKGVHSLHDTIRGQLSEPLAIIDKARQGMNEALRRPR